MSFATLEKAVLTEARDVFMNRKLRMKDIIEWSTAPLKAHDGEVIALLPILGVNVSVAKEFDKRKSSNAD